MALIRVRSKERKKKLEQEGKLYYCILEFEKDPDDGTTLETIIAHFKSEKEMDEAFKKLLNPFKYTTGYFEEVKY